MSDPTMFAAGHIRPGWPSYQHTRAADRMIGEVCRKVERRRELRARLDRWADRAMTLSVLLILPAVFWMAVISMIAGALR